MSDTHNIASKRWDSNLNKFERAGAAWWNSLTDHDRRRALIAAQEAGLPCTAADAYRLHLRQSSDAAKLAMFPRLVEALETTLDDAPAFTDTGMYEQKVRRQAARDLLAEARKLTKED